MKYKELENTLNDIRVIKNKITNIQFILNCLDSGFIDETILHIHFLPKYSEENQKINIIPSLLKNVIEEQLKFLENELRDKREYLLNHKVEIDDLFEEVLNEEN
jgi:hypothetical protein